MDKKVKKKVFFGIFWIMACIGTLAGIGVYYSGERIRSMAAANDMDLILETVFRWVTILSQNNYHYWAAPAVVAVFLILGILLWLAAVVSIKDLISDENPVAGEKRNSTHPKKDFIDHKIEQERKRRLFLHSLSILQREGRLLDFFDEDLSRYEDDQIGAAVRSIQEDCKKAVKKYIDPRPVLEGNEGDAVTIEEGFDIDAVTLVGNVSGQPPFEGVIKHPGWKAGKKDVPKLSDIQDPSIMTPAEVEIQ